MAKAEYKLLPNEAVIVKQERIMYGGAIANFTSELILTNINLVLISKGILGNAKNIQVFPIKQIKVFNNQAQVILSKTRGLWPQLEVYFINGNEKFGFESKQEVVNWINKINQLVTGEAVEMNVSTKEMLPGFEMVTDMLGDTVGTFKNMLGIKPRQSNYQIKEVVEKVAVKCCFCGASIQGKKGHVVL
jgi:hypothetical protein